MTTGDVILEQVAGAKKELVFSPSQLTAYLACPHLAALDLAVRRGELKRPFRANRHADLIRTKGEEHEAAYLAQLRSDGRELHTIRTDDWDFVRASSETAELMRAGAEVIYQATFFDGQWRGFAVFVVRVDTPSELGDFSYEAVDTKLARHARPAHVLQLCFYTEQIARIQGVAPRAMHVVTGIGERETFVPEDYMAYYRRLKSRFLDVVANGGDAYPYPVDHCGLCDFLSLCQKQWADDDHLVLVAGMARSQVDRLTAAGITTLEALGTAAPETRIKKMRAPTFENLRHQAELQLHHRKTREHRVDTLPLEPDQGFAVMPKPSRGDIWLDFEGHPWFEPARGLEYLFGWVELGDGGEPHYEQIWARDRKEEKGAFEQLMDAICERRRRYPDMHVY